MSGRRSLWRGRKVMVTGSTGFLGEAVTRELLQLDATVIAVVENRFLLSQFSRERSAKRLNVMYGRIEDTCALYTALAIHEISVIFHLADCAGEPGRPGSRIEGDDRGMAAVMRAAALRHPLLPVIAVRPSEQLRLVGAEPGGTVPHGIARFGELFGAGDRQLTHLVPKHITALLAGQRPVAADSLARDHVFTQDAARACIAVAEAVGTGSTRVEANFRSGWNWTEAELSHLVSETIAGRPPQSASGSAPENPFGWKPEVAVTTALSETVAWYRESVSFRPSISSTKELIRKAA